MSLAKTKGGRVKNQSGFNSLSLFNKFSEQKNIMDFLGTTFVIWEMLKYVKRKIVIDLNISSVRRNKYFAKIRK